MSDPMHMHECVECTQIDPFMVDSDFDGYLLFAHEICLQILQ